MIQPLRLLFLFHTQTLTSPSSDLHPPCRSIFSFSLGHDQLASEVSLTTPRGTASLRTGFGWCGPGGTHVATLHN
ncbi:hypothetical protein PF004_g31784 [Phytophthora fragariae]|uniref:Secreted protein n=1 Tax=Phytophthora fragariae TaxID=53985 RepID=A0A6G0M8F6_9STRA|nr:hypothetical protein PF004_g31784 [Phytophthora fragariae]